MHKYADHCKHTGLTVGMINIIRYAVKQATIECRLPCTLLRSRCY